MTHFKLLCTGGSWVILPDQGPRSDQPHPPVQDHPEGHGRGPLRASERPVLDHQGHHLDELAGDRHHGPGLRLSPEQEESGLLEKDDVRHGGPLQGRGNAEGPTGEIEPERREAGVPGAL